MFSRWHAVVGIALIGCICASCGTDVGNDTPDATAISPACMEAENHSDLEFIQTEIFDRSCAFSRSCHMGAAPSALGLNLEDGNSEADLVGVPARTPQAAGFDLVVAGDPDSSYLMVVLGFVDGPLGAAGTMPFNSPLLCDQKLGAIQRWINSL